MINPLETAKKTIILLGKHKKEIAYAAVLDALFLVIYGFVRSSFADRITDHLLVIGSAVSKYSVNNPKSQESFLTVLSITKTTPYFLKFLVLLAGLTFCGYALYSIFHGTAWWVSRIIAGHQQESNYQTYLQQFAKLNLVWIVFIIIGNVWQFMYVFRHGATTDQLPINWYILAYYLVIVYFAGISYSNPAALSAWASWKQSVKKGVLSWKTIVPGFFFLAALVIGIHFLLVGARLIHHLLFFITGVCLVFPLITYIRVYFAEMTSKKL